MEKLTTQSSGYFHFFFILLVSKTEAKEKPNVYNNYSVREKFTKHSYVSLI